MDQRLFQYAVILQPTKEEAKEGKQAEIITDVTTIVGTDENSVRMAIAMDIPKEYKTKLDRVQIALRPF